MADDLGWSDIGYQGAEYETPHIDALAAGGVRMNRYYAYPMCSPTRTALMTGRTGLRMGIDYRLGPENGVPLSEEMLPVILKNGGYQTFMTGKWHLGNRGEEYLPNARGFDHFYGLLGSGIDYYEHENQGRADWYRNGVALEEEGYSTELLTAEAVRLIRERDERRPFFLYVAYNAPHTPFQAPEAYRERFADIEDGRRRTYAAMISVMDEGVGEIVQTIESEGLRDNTLVIWVSDNGGGRQAGRNSPLKGYKASVFEGGIRVPGLVNWPGMVEAGGEMDDFLSVHDWLPTLAGLAKLDWTPKHELDGADIWGAIQGTEELGERSLVIGYNGERAAIKEGYKVVKPASSARDGGDVFLYNILEDPNETNNLANRMPEKLNELLALLDPYPVMEDASGGRPGQRGGQRQGAGRGPVSADAILERLDENGNGQVDFSEIPETPERRKAAFTAYDENGDEALSKEELAKGLSESGGRGGERRRPENRGGGRN